MPKPGETGIKRVVDAAGYSMLGFKACWKNEAAFRQEVFLCIVLVPLGFYLGGNGVERSILIGACLQVLIVELLNSGIEAIVDRVGSEHHELSGRAKDQGSAAVFISLSLVAIVWALILIPKYF